MLKRFNLKSPSLNFKSKNSTCCLVVNIRQLNRLQNGNLKKQERLNHNNHRKNAENQNYSSP